MNNNMHVIVDFSYLYYNAMFRYDGGKCKKLTTMLNGEVVDITIIYLVVQQIESFRKANQEGCDGEVTMSICFDMPSSRKEEEGGEEYKANRVKRLDETDFERMCTIKDMLESVGYNVYRAEGMEADDLVYGLVSKYKDNFGLTMIYTPDCDLAINIQPYVGVMRYKAAIGGYIRIGVRTFEEILSKELKCNMPYNALLIFKSTVGDSSDGIKGIKGFGPKAFDKMVCELGNSVDWKEDFQNPEKAKGILERVFEGEKLEQALNSLKLVSPIEVSDEILTAPISRERNTAVYELYNFKSLI